MKKEESKKIKVGKDSVVIGPTDSNGNTIINQPMAVGRGAYADSGSIAIGAGAGAGSKIYIMVDSINQLVQNSNDPELIKAFTEFYSSLKEPKKNKALLSRLWNVIKVSATLGSASRLVNQISTWIEQL